MAKKYGVLIHLLFLSLLPIPVLSFAQVTVNGGYATTSGPSPVAIPLSTADTPLIVTPDVALPGSGPAVGAPLRNANDSRSVIGPSVTKESLSEEPGVGSGSELEPSSQIGSEPFEFGMQHFISGATEARDPNPSLAEIAGQFKAKHHHSGCIFDNDSLRHLSASAAESC
jgi:hypothetical protein